jgi:beta-glucosidase/6-phospho-beta-glucosidase/beta-galactosidase
MTAALDASAGANAPAFASFFLGGFECSTQRRARDRRRLDMIHATRHDRFCAQDYRALEALGIRTVRDGLRWHLIEAQPGEYDWSSAIPMLEAARTTRTQVIWDLCHYGWPDHLDIWSADFAPRFAAFAAAAAMQVRRHGGLPWYCVINEISFWSWAGGDMRLFAPFCRHRGYELKHVLAGAAIAAVRAIRAVEPAARFIHCEPTIQVRPRRPADAAEAAHAHQAQYEAWDMIAGRLAPQLGGAPELLDVLGLNYYSNNQWMLRGRTIPRDAPAYRPLRELLAENHARYGRPLLIAETGAEGDLRAGWLRYVCEEVRAVQAAGVPVLGICLYPVTDYPGWMNGRHCPAGLLGMTDAEGQRPVHAPLAEELARQRALFESRSSMSARDVVAVD